MELAEVLDRVDAPDELVDWARRGALDFDQAWSGTGRADHRIWLAAVGGAPIEVVIEAGAAAVLAAEDRFSVRASPVAQAIEAAVAGGERDELLSAAASCEKVAEGGMGDYRQAIPPGYERVARGAALLAHAADGLASAEATGEASRLGEARDRGAALGVGVQIALPARAGPARLDVVAEARNPAQGALLFCVAAAAQAALEAEGALTAAGATADEARLAIDRAVRASLEVS